VMDIRMPSINKVIITGNLVRDPETRILENGIHLAKMSIANNQRYRGRDGSWQEKTCYVTVIAWRKTAELVSEFCRKGSPVLVEGELTYSAWEDKDGNPRNRVEINARRVQFLEKRDSDQGQDRPAASRGGGRDGYDDYGPEPDPGSMPDDDIPF